MVVFAVSPIIGFIPVTVAVTFIGSPAILVTEMIFNNAVKLPLVWKNTFPAATPSALNPVTVIVLTSSVLNVGYLFVSGGAATSVQPSFCFLINLISEASSDASTQAYSISTVSATVKPAGRSIEKPPLPEIFIMPVSSSKS